MKPEDYLVVQARIAKERENLGRLLDQMSRHCLYPELHTESIGGFGLCDNEALRIIGSPRSACRCSHFGIRAMLWASESDGKAGLRRDRPIETMRSRCLSSLPENPTVGSESSLSVAARFPKSQIACLAAHFRNACVPYITCGT